MARLSFRTRLLLLLSTMVLTTVALVTWAASESAASAFDALDTQRTAALVAQFRAEFARRGAEVAEQAGSIAASEEVLQVAIEANRPEPDFASFFDLAERLATAHRLPFVEILNEKGAIVSSAQWPARFGYPKAPLLPQNTYGHGPMLLREDHLKGSGLALMGARPVAVGDARVWVLAGIPVDQQFLDSLVLPEGMRVLLVPTLERFPEQFKTPLHSDLDPALAALVMAVRRGAEQLTRTVTLPTGEEQFTAIALREDTGVPGRNATGSATNRTLLGVLLVGSSRAGRNELLARIRRNGAAFAALGFALALAVAFWLSRRITKPLEELAAGARAVTEGAWETRVQIHSGDEIGQLAEDFNRMTAQLVEQRDRLVQSERVAAWRELARRLAHELKNPLFPLQITVENLQRARALAAERGTEEARAQFDDVFEESTATLLAEMANLKTIIGRFSDFARMPPPEMRPVEVNELVRESVRLFDAQFAADPSASIEASLALDDAAGSIEADPELLRRALRNLLLNAIDAMPEGGTLRVTSSRHAAALTISVTDTGTGITPEEAARLFTPYYTTRRHGTGLGLAIVQSVVADHKGRIRVLSEPGAGTTFVLELPLTQTPAAEGLE